MGWREQAAAAWDGLAAGNSLLVPNIKCIKPARHHNVCLQLTLVWAQKETRPSAVQLHRALAVGFVDIPSHSLRRKKGTNGISDYKVFLLIDNTDFCCI